MSLVDVAAKHRGRCRVKTAAEAVPPLGDRAAATREARVLPALFA